MVWGSVFFHLPTEGTANERIEFDILDLGKCEVGVYKKKHFLKANIRLYIELEFFFVNGIISYNVICWTQKFESYEHTILMLSAHHCFTIHPMLSFKITTGYNSIEPPSGVPGSVNNDYVIKFLLPINFLKLFLNR